MNAPGAATVAVSTTIAAPADAVYAMVSDVTRMGEWSPECRRCEWLGGATGPTVGARFKGHNRNGWRRWSTTARVTAAEPGRRFAFDVEAQLGLKVAGWGYTFEPDGDGSSCTVTETWQDHRANPVITAVTGIAVGVKDRPEHNRRGMEQTLARIKAVAEASR